MFYPTLSGFLRKPNGHCQFLGIKAGSSQMRFPDGPYGCPISLFFSFLFSITIYDSDDSSFRYFAQRSRIANADPVLHPRSDYIVMKLQIRLSSFELPFALRFYNPFCLPATAVLIVLARNRRQHVQHHAVYRAQ